MKTVGMFSFGRIQSARCPNKMLRSFAGTTLTDIVLSKLRRFGDEAFFAGYEDEFRIKCEAHGVRFVRRDLRSVTVDGPIRDILGFLEHVSFDYVLLVSACAPFLRAGTIEGFLNGCIDEGYRPAISVDVRRHHFVTPDGRAVNFDAAATTLNTKAVGPLYELADALYFFDRRYFVEHGRYWDWRDVRFVQLPDRMAYVDIDDEDDFAQGEAFWRVLPAVSA